MFQPKCSQWVAESRPDVYLAQRLLDFNFGILDGLVTLHRRPVCSVAALADQAAQGHRQAFDALINELQSLVSQPVVIVVDEHNEIFKVQKETDVFFRQFTISTSYLSGVCARPHRRSDSSQRRMFAILSGSAHSRFEGSLQSSLRGWLRHIRPLEPDMFEQACFGGAAQKVRASPLPPPQVD